MIQLPPYQIEMHAILKFIPNRQFFYLNYNEKKNQIIDDFQSIKTQSENTISSR